jgi:exodeoxyribonuclease VII small subunit
MAFEEALKKLEETVTQLETGDVSLEQALDLFEEGIRVSKACAEILNAAQERIRRLTEDEAGTFRLVSQDIEA